MHSSSYRSESVPLRRGVKNAAAASSIPQNVTTGLKPPKVKLTVCCRVRPVIPLDYKHATTKRNAPEICVHCSQDGQSIKLIQDHMHSKDFKVDHSFDTSASQQDVYKLALRPLVKECIQGYHATCMVYGQTTSGKTYTMFGSENKLGITHLAINEIFDAVQQYEQEDLIAKVFLSFYQVYIENVYDLLDDHVVVHGQKAPIPLNIRNENESSFQVEGLKQVYVKTRDMAYQVISQGLERRVVHSNAYNIRSSRSHAILQIHLDFEECDDHNPMDRKASSSSTYNRNGNLIEKKYLVRRRTLTLVDLAGSERVESYRQTAKQQLAEAGMINKSIAALGNCIYALGNREISGDPTLHVPYRDCKLTRLLADSLGGNSKLCVITTISPCVVNYDETSSTLKFAARAKMVKKVVKKPRAEEYTMETEILPYLQPLDEGDIEEEKDFLQHGDVPHDAPYGNPYVQSATPVADGYAYQGNPFPGTPHGNNGMNPPINYHQQTPNPPRHVPVPQYSSAMRPPPPPPLGLSSSGGFKPFHFEKPNQTFNLRDFLQACTMAKKAFDPTSTESYELPPKDDVSLLGTGSTATPYSHGYHSHPSRIESAVEVIPEEIDAYYRYARVPSDSRLINDPNEVEDGTPSRKGKMSTADFQFQTEAPNTNYIVKCHKSVQTWSMTPTATEGKAFDGTLDDFGTIKPPSKMDQVTEIDEETLMYTTSTIQDPTQRDELLKLAKLSPMELVCSLAEMRTAVFHLSEALRQRDEQVRLLQELVLDVTERNNNAVGGEVQEDSHAYPVNNFSATSYSYDINSASYEASPEYGSRLPSFDASDRRW